MTTQSKNCSDCASCQEKVSDTWASDELLAAHLPLVNRHFIDVKLLTKYSQQLTTEQWQNDLAFSCFYLHFCKDSWFYLNYFMQTTWRHNVSLRSLIHCTALLVALVCLQHRLSFFTSACLLQSTGVGSGTESMAARQDKVALILRLQASRPHMPTPTQMCTVLPATWKTSLHITANQLIC